jgi:hypothetical protein
MIILYWYLAVVAVINVPLCAWVVWKVYWGPPQ